jgi:hypothetical protein
MNKPINRTNVAEHLLEYQLQMVGKKPIDIIDDDKWYFNWTMTRKQRDELRLYAIPLIQKTFKINKTRANETFNWWEMHFGLRLKG